MKLPYVALFSTMQANFQINFRSIEDFTKEVFAYKQFENGFLWAKLFDANNGEFIMDGKYV